MQATCVLSAILAIIALGTAAPNPAAEANKGKIIGDTAELWQRLGKAATEKSPFQQAAELREQANKVKAEFAPKLDDKFKIFN